MTESRLVFLAVAGVLVAGTAAGQIPDPIVGVAFESPVALSWQPAVNADTYNVYRGTLSGLGSEIPGRCHGFRITSASFTTEAVPEAGEGFFYLVTGESASAGEGTPGIDSDGQVRPLLGACTTVMRAHVLNRLGYGWNEWTGDRIESLGIDGYIAEQLDPATIDESTNDALNDRLFPLTPPGNVVELVAQQVVRGVYARRQLEAQAASFWANHFNTFWLKVEMTLRDWFPMCEEPGVPPQCSENFPARSQLEASLMMDAELAKFRNLAFYGNFRQMVEASALSPAMIIYLDSVLSVAGNPNENFPRELMELYTLGVSGGYTQTDVEQLARVITGWTICKKEIDDLDDPLAPCIPNYWEHLPYGKFTADFVPELHDCEAKTLFAGEPEEITIPNTCGDPVQGVDDLFLALDAIVAHPSTPRFISSKILERFVTEEPTEEMIDALVAAWNDTGNPHGVGDMQAVLGAALSLPEFLDPDRVRDKVKTPMEHLISAMRATRGETDGIVNVYSFLTATAHVVHFNAAPTGWAEAGFNWINTNNMLDRQNFGYTLLSSNDPDFSAKPLQMLNDAGIDLGPGNAEAIVDFFVERLFGGAVTPFERQAAIDYLNTDDDGLPDDYDLGRIREVVGILLGYPQFEEQ